MRPIIEKGRAREGSIPASPNAIHRKSGQKAPMSSAQAGARGARLSMASPAAKCAAYIRWTFVCWRY
jgi:hypothetical protein